MISDQTINGHGKVVGQFGTVGPSGNTNVSVGSHGISIEGAGSCPNLHSQTPQCVTAGAVQLGLRQSLQYQPISHYWALQWGELAIFLGAAVVLSGLCLWWSRHRLV